MGGDCCSTTVRRVECHDLETRRDARVGREYGDVVGPGVYTPRRHLPGLQTYTFVPEPSSHIGRDRRVAALVLRRRRKPPEFAMSPPRRPLLLIALASAGISARPTISWISDPNAVKKTSSGPSMDAGFRFELGRFHRTVSSNGRKQGYWARQLETMQRTRPITIGKALHESSMHCLTNNEARSQEEESRSMYGV